MYVGPGLLIIFIYFFIPSFFIIIFSFCVTTVVLYLSKASPADRFLAILSLILLILDGPRVTLSFFYFLFPCWAFCKGVSLSEGQWS